jgi:hypothetical protein
MTQTAPATTVLNFEIGTFEFVSDFGFGISDFPEGVWLSIKVTTQPRRGTRDTKGKRMEMSLMKPAKLTLVRPLSALVVRFVPFCGYA